MKIIKQGPAECVLATIANLANKEFGEVKDIAARTTGGRSWEQWATLDCFPAPSLKYTCSIRYVLDTCGIMDSVGPHVDELAYVKPGQRAAVKRLPSLGRGFLTLSNGPVSHVIAWEHGRLFDSGRERVELEQGSTEGETLGQLMRRYRRQCSYIWIAAMVRTSGRRSISPICQ